MNKYKASDKLSI